MLQELGGVEPLHDVLGELPRARLGTVAEDGDAGRRRDRPLLDDPLPEERIQHARLPRVELAHDHDEEELVEVVDEVVDGVERFGVGAEPLQERAEGAERLTLFVEQGAGGGGEQRVQEQQRPGPWR